MKAIITKSLMILGVIASSAALTTASPSRLNLITGNQGQQVRYVMTVPVKSPFEMARYAGWLRQQGYDVAGYRWKKGEIEVITDSAGILKLQQTKLKGLVTASKGLAPGQEKMDERYLNPAKVEQKLKALNAQFPQWTRLEQIGTSLQGRAIWALLLSTTPNARDARNLEKPSLIFDGMHHARELMTSEIVMDVAESVLGTLARKDRQWSPVLERWNIWVVPMLNVDGNNIVWTQNSMWRKNARGDGKNTFGVDINRNYSFNWNKCNGSSGSQGGQDYRGPSGGSEPETQALMKLGQLVQPTASLSYHSYSELVLYPYGCRGVVTGENALISKVATEVAKILPSDDGRGTYTPGTPWQLLYSVDGDSMSYMFGEFGALALTFEVNQEFQPSYDIKAATVAKHRKAWAYFLNRIDQNLLSLKVVDGRTNQPAMAQIGVLNIQQTQGEKPFRTNAAGSYFKVLDPGAYTILVQLKDGRQQQIQVQMNGQPQSQTVVIN